MLEIKGPTKVLIKIMDKEYLVRKPTLGEVETNAEDAKKNEADPSLNLKNTVSFISSLGIPSDILKQLEVEQVVGIMEYLNGGKKK